MRERGNYINWMEDIFPLKKTLKLATKEAYKPNDRVECSLGSSDLATVRSEK